MGIHVEVEIGQQANLRHGRHLLEGDDNRIHAWLQDLSVGIVPGFAVPYGKPLSLFRKVHPSHNLSISSHQSDWCGGVSLSA